MSDKSNVTVDESSLKQIPGVGERLARYLVEGGFESVEDVARANVAQLSGIEKVGESKAEQFMKEAREIAFDGGLDGSSDEDDGADDDEGLSFGDNEAGGPIAVWGDDRHMPSEVREAGHPDEIAKGTEEREAFLEDMQELFEAVVESPFAPDTLVVSEWSGWHVVTLAVARLLINSDAPCEPTVRKVEPQWPAWQEHVTDEDGEQVQIRDGGPYEELTSAGWAMFESANDAAVIGRARHALVVNNSDFEDRFQAEFKEQHPRGRYYRHYEEMDLEDAEEMMGVEVDEAEATANTELEVEDDEIQPPEDDEWHRGVMDERADDDFEDGNGLGSTEMTTKDSF